MHISTLSSSQILQVQNKDEHPKQCLKVGLYALGVILMIGGVVAAGVLYAHAGYYAYSCAIAGSILGLFFVSFGCYIRSSLPISEEILPISEETPPNTESFASEREKSFPKEDPFCTGLVPYSFIETKENYRTAKQKISSYFLNPESHSITPQEGRAMGIMLGMACGDSIGAPFEALPFKQEGYTVDQKGNRFDLKEGQWTDDTSMGLCLADVLLQEQRFDGIQLMWAFHDWWEHGYNNTFTGEETRNSVGLGGNIELAFNEFSKLQKDGSYSRHASGPYATQDGDIFTNGNGSLMRLGPVAIAAQTEEDALALAWEQSKVTHQGDEAAACCQLMAFLLYHALHLEIADAETRKKAVFQKLTHFHCQIATVNELAKGSKEVKNQKTNENENWNWQDSDFSINSSRLHGCAGSYAMDGLAMALNCIWTTSSFEEAVLKAATRGGDADTVGAIAGQLAGAIYGIEEIPKDWISKIHQWDRNGEIATRGYLLYSFVVKGH